MLIMSIRRFKSTSSAVLTEKFNFFLRRTYQTYYFFLDLVYVYGVLCHFQQYFSYIVVVVLLVKETRVPRENHWPIASHWQTISDNVASSTYTWPWMGVQNHNWLIAQVVVNQTTIWSRPRRIPLKKMIHVYEYFNIHL